MSAPVTGLRLTLLDGTYAVCRLPAGAPAPPIPVEAALFSVTRTPDEVSVVCREDLAPPGARCETGWRCLRVAGPLDLTLTGILAGLTAPLNAAGIPVFAISTYDTDYLLIRAGDLQATVRLLASAGYRVSALGCE